MFEGGRHDWNFEALGTEWVISTAEPLARDTADEVRAELDRIDSYWSRFRDDSTVAAMAHRAGHYRLAASDVELIDWYRRLYAFTGGSVTPLVGVTLDDAGYDADYSFIPADSVRRPPAWDEVFGDDDYDSGLALKVPALLDVGAAGKGFAVDRVSTILAAQTDAYLVDAGGDMQVSAAAGPMRVALEHPADPRRAIGIVTVDEGAICASAGNRRVWGGAASDGGWHHIIDPQTARPAWDVVATWVIAPQAMIADGLATALFFTPALALRRRFSYCRQGFHHVTLRRNGSVEHTDIPGLELFL